MCLAPWYLLCKIVSYRKHSMFKFGGKLLVSYALRKADTAPAVGQLEQTDVKLVTFFQHVSRLVCGSSGLDLLVGLVEKFVGNSHLGTLIKCCSCRACSPKDEVNVAMDVGCAIWHAVRLLAMDVGCAIRHTVRLLAMDVGCAIRHAVRLLQGVAGKPSQKPSRMSTISHCYMA